MPLRFLQYEIVELSVARSNAADKLDIFCSESRFIRSPGGMGPLTRHGSNGGRLHALLTRRFYFARFIFLVPCQEQ